MIDPGGLETDWMDELREGAIDGLIIGDALHAELGLGDNYSEFRPGYAVPGPITEQSDGRLRAGNGEAGMVARYRLARSMIEWGSPRGGPMISMTEVHRCAF
ncbi:hypothetical protein OG203_45545 [Nocardia sp. NBC_01499]|uniref:hypothetical protein n=1 Tax=Nocardia sp. NBC_01499 TaxID=2903597 RepID=UPI00386E7807